MIEEVETGGRKLIPEKFNTTQDKPQPTELSLENIRDFKKRLSLDDLDIQLLMHYVRIPATVLKKRYHHARSDMGRLLIKTAIAFQEDLGAEKIDALTKEEMKRIEAFRKRGLNSGEIAADIVVGRNLQAFVQIEMYLRKDIEARNTCTVKRYASISKLMIDSTR